MNICLLTPTFLPKLGGVEIIVSSLADQYIRAGHRVIVVTQWPRKGRGLAQDHTLAYPVVRYRRPISFVWSFGLRGITKALDRAYKELAFDVIHCHLAFPAGPVALAYAKSRNIPVVITTHGSDIRLDSRYRQRKSLWEKISRSLREADAVTAISDEMKSLLQQVIGESSKEIPLIPNAVDVEEFNNPVRFDSTWPIHPDKPFVLYLGGLTHKKGVNFLMEAISSLSKAGKWSAKLIVAGDGSDRRELEELTRANGLSQTVQFIGKVEGALKKYLLQNCRYVVMPSLTEGFPLVALEAFSCGKPLVASSVGRLTELLSENQNLGLLSVPGDSSLLADAIMKMESQLQNYKPEPIRNFARQFDWAKVSQAYLDLYRRVINAK
ncbi:MAG: glycosyltransferase family 4 protein [Phycisphaerae bacterium]